MPRKYFRKKRNYVTKSEVKKIIQGEAETKVKTLEFTSATVTQTALTYDLTQIATGDGANGRDGHQIRLKSLFARFFISGDDATNVVRAVLYIPKDPGDVLSTLSVTNTIDLDNYIVLHDKLLTTQTSGTNVRVFSLSKNLRNRICQYTGTSSTSCSKNPIKLAFVSDSAVSGPILKGNTILYYKDI